MDARIREVIARLEQLRSRQITGPEKRVADEAIALVRELLEDQ
jgi:hypothetical protein